jgi:hypothetical protein
MEEKDRYIHVINKLSQYSEKDLSQKEKLSIVDIVLSIDPNDPEVIKKKEIISNKDIFRWSIRDTESKKNTTHINLYLIFHYSEKMLEEMDRRNFPMEQKQYACKKVFYFLCKFLGKKTDSNNPRLFVEKREEGNEISNNDLGEMIQVFRCQEFYFKESQFEIINFWDSIRVYKSKDGLVAIPKKGEFFSENGYYHDKAKEKTNVIKPKIEETSKIVEASHIINLETGQLVKKDVKINKKDFEIILKEKDNVLEWHIPIGCSLQNFDEAVKEVAVFTKNYLKDKNIKIIVIMSWLLDKNFWKTHNILLKKNKNKESNVFYFSNKFNLFPVPYSEEYWERHLDKTRIEKIRKNLKIKPKASTLETAMADYFNNGHKLIELGGFVTL